MLKRLAKTPHFCLNYGKLYFIACAANRFKGRLNVQAAFFVGGKMGRLKTVSARLGGAAVRIAAVGETGSARAAKGKSSSARGYGYKWQKARALYLSAHPLCVMCSTDALPVAAVVVDHIKPHGGDLVLFWDKSNWQPLCKHCHDSAKQRAEHKARRGG